MGRAARPPLRAFPDAISGLHLTDVIRHRDGMPVYALNLFDLADNDDYREYSKRSLGAVQKYGGTVPALGKLIGAAEGGDTEPRQALVLVEWPSREAFDSSSPTRRTRTCTPCARTAPSATSGGSTRSSTTSAPSSPHKGMESRHRTFRPGVMRTCVRTMILHADLDAFYASVAQRDDPTLRGKPVVVGAGVVLAASYEARAFGVRSGMSGRERRLVCPQAVVARADFEACLKASRAVRRVLEKTGARVRPASIDEAFLEIGHLDASPEEIGAQIRAEVWDKVGLPITVGGGSTRLIAKMAGSAAKPDGLRIVAPGEELSFLRPLPLASIWGLGPSSAAKLHARGLRTVGDLAELGEAEVIAILGKGPGRTVYGLARNSEVRREVRVRSGGRRSFGAQSALGRPQRSPEAVDRALARVVVRVSERMEKAGRVGRTVVLRLRYDDYTTRTTRSLTMPMATASAPTLLDAARDLMAEAMPDALDRGLTLVGITVTNLAEPKPEGQMALELVAA